MQKTLDLDSFADKEEKTVEQAEPSKETEKKQPIAIELAKKQRAISIAEFFEKNRHLLGFDNKKKALLTTVKEAVDNALDACEEANILPDISIEIIDFGNDRFRIIVEDNGPGIVKKQIPYIFARLLYGSKFHRLKQQRGQQGIGITASVMYGQLTTGRAAKIISRISKDHPAVYTELKLNTTKNKPDILKQEETEWEKEHGTKVEIDLEASYMKGLQSVDEYIKETAIINPHSTIIYTNPKAEQIIYPRATDKLPKETKEIKPHPHGVELGILIKMLQNTEYRTLQAFLTNEFSRVGSGTAKQICENAAVLPNTKPGRINREMAEKLMQAIQNTKIMNPQTDCIAPIGKNLLLKGLQKEVKAEFYTSTTRPPSVYRGNPFIVEAAIAYGGNLPAEDSVNIMRYANRVPLLYQQGACSITSSVIKTNWRNYGLKQSRNSIPIGPCVVLVHMASVWVPFTSEAKEAIAHYPEIVKEIKLALQECGRDLGSYLSKKRRLKKELKKIDYISKYLPHVSIALKNILNLDDSQKARLEEYLREVLEKSRSMRLPDIKNEIINDSELNGEEFGFDEEELNGDSEDADLEEEGSEDDK
ncbi:DNA topoisomerase VI subunit B [Candidatus Woesearchaeota archaeon]|nr:DNA topoisomerase VI subunit B [Candidatus Woesearchaeota archaeon]